jgi:glycosyltransferase involved in cell wall biosynthesis
MRIGLVTGSFLPVIGGLQWKVHFLATEYHRRGHEVTVFHVKQPEDGPLPVKPVYDIVAIGPKPFPGYGRLGIAEYWFSRRLLGFHRRAPLDLLHCHGIDVPTRFGVCVKRKSGIPVVATTSGHDIMPLPSAGYDSRRRRYFLRSRPYYERMIRDNMRCVDAVGAISRRARQELENMGATARILDIPNGVDWAAFQCGPNDWLRQRLGLPASAVIVVSLGRNDPQKGYESGLQAFALLAAKVPAAHYVIAGPGVPALDQVVTRTACADRIHLLDGVPMSEVPKMLWSADVFFSPSLVEGFAQVAVQAMACARPCVLSDCPGNEDFQGHPFAVLGGAGNAASLAHALESVVCDSSRRCEMSAAAHAASRRYAWNLIAGEYLDAFQDLVSTRLSRTL